MTWNDRLEVARSRRGIKPAALARLVGVSAPTLSDWRSGKIRELNAVNAYKVCAALKVRMEWLLFGKGDMEDTDQTPAQPQHTPAHDALIGYFDGLTPSQQAELMRSLSETQQRNDELLAELLARRKAS